MIRSLISSVYSRAVSTATYFAEKSIAIVEPFTPIVVKTYTKSAVEFGKKAYEDPYQVAKQYTISLCRNVPPVVLKYGQAVTNRVLPVYLYGKTSVDSTANYVRSLVMFAKKLTLGAIETAQNAALETIHITSSKAQETRDYAVSTLMVISDRALLFVKKP